MKKNILSLCCMVLAVASAMAANRLYIEDFGIDAGETRQVALMLDNDIAFTGFQVDLVLPDGLTIETKSNGDPKVTVNTARADDHQMVTNFRPDGRISILMMSLASTEITGNTGAIVTFNLTASADFSGTHVIEIKNAELTSPSGQTEKPADTTCTVTGPSGQVDPQPSGNRLYIEDFGIDAGETRQVALMLDNDIAFTGFQVDLVLPDGLTIETKSNGDPKVTVNTARADDHQMVTNFRPDGRISILMMSLASTEITDNTGAIVTFNLTASADFSGTHVIEIKNAELTSPSGQTEKPADTTCTVTGPSAPLPTTLELSDKAIRLQLAQTHPLTVVTEGAGEVAWSSSDATIASVDANGVVTAHKNGIAIITATEANGASTWCSVYSYLHCDVNEDNKVDVSDVNQVVNKILGK